MPSELELILRLLLAGALAGALGVERELTEQPAGFRTHILVGLGAALFAILSAYGFATVLAGEPSRGVSADVTRIASQIVVGIGFLGGGAILKYGSTVRGLTTAASLWVTAAIGTAIGLGALVLGSVTAGMVLAALVGGRPLRTLMRRYAIGKDEFEVEADVELDIEKMLQQVRRLGVRIEEMRVGEQGKNRSIHLTVRVPPQIRPAEIVESLSRDPHVRNVEWSGN
jgi:putative Mg2+ transporter-C (MgtC) family protein